MLIDPVWSTSITGVPKPQQTSNSFMQMTITFKKNGCCHLLSINKLTNPLELIHFLCTREQRKVMENPHKISKNVCFRTGLYETCASVLFFWWLLQASFHRLEVYFCWEEQPLSCSWRMIFDGLVSDGVIENVGLVVLHKNTFFGTHITAHGWDGLWFTLTTLRPPLVVALHACGKRIELSCQKLQHIIIIKDLSSTRIQL